MEAAQQKTVEYYIPSFYCGVSSYILCRSVFKGHIKLWSCQSKRGVHVLLCFRLKWSRNGGKYQCTEYQQSWIRKRTQISFSIRLTENSSAAQKRTYHQRILLYQNRELYRSLRNTTEILTLKRFVSSVRSTGLIYYVNMYITYMSMFIL